MPLRSPILDDRSYAQLRDELIARIPVYAPEWTDHHPSDPGITLLELFAFLGENLLYRFNQIPDATKLAFLDLLHVPLRPATPATGIVRFSSDVVDAAVDRNQRLLAGDVAFQTLDEVSVWPVTALAAIREVVDEALDADTAEFVSRAAVSVGASTAAIAEYRTSFGAISPMKPGRDVLDPAMSIDGTIYVALTSEQPDLTVMAGGRLSIGIVPTADVPSMAVRAETPCDGAGGGTITPPMQWQICTTTAVPDAPVPASADPVWRSLEVVGDTSAGLTRAGVIELRLPAALDDIGLYEPADPDAVGAGDQPPLIENDDLAEGLFAWLRVFRPTGGDLPAIEWLDVNAARVEQALSARAEFLGIGTGEPGQTRSLVNPNVLGDADVEVEEHGARRWVPWTQVESFRSSTVDDRHFVVDAEAGTVTCGDGRRGRVWQIGERVRVKHYRHGGGAAGNVGPATISKVVGKPRCRGHQRVAHQGWRRRRGSHRRCRAHPRGVPPPRSGGYGFGLS